MMTAEEFIEELKDVVHPKEKYLAIHIDEKGYKEIVKNYTPPVRVLEPEVDTNEPFIHLVTHYDMTHTFIGPVWFDLDDSMLLEDEINFHVAKYDGDFLCISKETGEVLVFSSQDLTFKTHKYRCAKDGASFLAALVVVAAFIESTTFQRDLLDNESVLDTMAEHCAELAGGQEYFEFYKMTLKGDVPEEDWD
jgi:hypothetical protein